MNAIQDRRQAESRWVSIAADINDNNRVSGRREFTDRRGAYLDVTQDSEHFLFMMCNWLGDNTKGAWHIGPNESEPKGSPVSCRVRFDDPYDLEAFSVWLEIWG